MLAALFSDYSERRALLMTKTNIYEFIPDTTHTIHDI